MSSFIDSRRLHWIVFYKLLQTLISVTSIPLDVHYSDKVRYPLCCRVSKLPDLSTATQVKEISRPSSLIIPSRRSSMKYQKTYAVSCMDSASSRRNSVSVQSSQYHDPSNSPLNSSTYHRKTHSSPIERSTESRGSKFTEIIISGYGNGMGPITNVASIYSRSSTSELSHYDSSISRSDTHSSANTSFSIYSASIYSQDDHCDATSRG